MFVGIAQEKQMKFQHTENIRMMEERERVMNIMNMKEMSLEEEEQDRASLEEDEPQKQSPINSSKEIVP